MKRTHKFKGNFFSNPSIVANCIQPFIEKLSEKFLCVF